MQLHSSLSVAPLLRVASRTNIENCWDSNSLSFSCAANWVKYKNWKNNQTIGDSYECVFSRIPKNKPITIFDHYGMPIDANIQRFPDKEEPEYEFLRYVPTMLTPAMCFFSFENAAPNGHFHFEGTTADSSRFQLEKYAEYMGYTPSDAAFLYISDSLSFYRELQAQIPAAISENKKNLTQKRYYLSQIQNDSQFYGARICYDKHQRYDIFDERPNTPEELFWKFPEYSLQNEVRLIIPHWNFIQEYDIHHPDNYDRSKNYLRVYLPHLHNYARYIG